MEHNVAAPEDIIPTDDKTPTEETVDMEQNVAAPEDIIPTDDKTPTAETGDAVGGEEKSVQGNTDDAVKGKEITVNEEDNTASRLHSGKAVTRSTNTGKQPPKLTVHEFYRRKAEAAEAERKKKNSKGGKRNALSCFINAAITIVNNNKQPKFTATNATAILILLRTVAI